MLKPGFHVTKPDKGTDSFLAMLASDVRGCFALVVKSGARSTDFNVRKSAIRALVQLGLHVYQVKVSGRIVLLVSPSELTDGAAALIIESAIAGWTKLPLHEISGMGGERHYHRVRAGVDWTAPILLDAYILRRYGRHSVPDYASELQEALTLASLSYRAALMRYRDTPTAALSRQCTVLGRTVSRYREAVRHAMTAVPYRSATTNT